MTKFSDIPIALGVCRFFEGGVIYAAEDYEPIKDWLTKQGLLELVQNPMGQNEGLDLPVKRWCYNDARAQVAYALIRTLPVGVMESATNEQLALFAEVLLLQRQYRQSTYDMVDELLTTMRAVDLPERSELKQLSEARSLELRSIDSLLGDWRPRLPFLNESDQVELFSELYKDWTVDDAVFLYKEGLSDALMAHPSFEKLVGGRLEHLGVVPQGIRSLVGRVVRLCQCMEEDGSPEQAAVLREVDRRLDAFGIQPTVGELEFSAKPLAYRRAFKALRSGNRKLVEVDRSLWDDALVDVSLKLDWEQIKMLDAPWLTEIRCEHAVVFGSAQYLKYVPKELQTLDMLNLAFNEDPELIRYANPDRLTLDLAYNVVSAKGQLLRYIPARLLTEGVAKAALQQTVAAWPFVPEQKRTTEVCRVAVEADPNCLSLIPEACRTLTTCLTAVTGEPKQAKFVPQAVWDNEEFQRQLRESGVDVHLYR